MKGDDQEALKTGRHPHLGFPQSGLGAALFFSLQADVSALGISAAAFS